MENGRGLENRDPNQNGGPPNVYNALRVANVAGTKVNHLVVGYGFERGTGIRKHKYPRKLKVVELQVSSPEKL